MRKPATDLKNFDMFTPGEEVGVSPWLGVDQEMISQFGEATRDPDPMHVDPDWAKENTPYGGTIAFGFLTVSLLTCLLHGALGTSPSREPTTIGYFMNYGFDHLRLVSPIPVGSRVRGRFKTLEMRENQNGKRIVKFGCAVEIEGQEKPALIGEWLAVWVPASAEA